ncbi:MAG: TetR/AcrR family transcriptional regulator [Deltaproteobacteria bacterium]|nr:TetR/AcrR family transcriptional regulator [Deltaproteobacteria bacterium]MBW2396796.1 TetR/AcrR family transcriptional regulator [Deltaproteobacteria bacterium]
MALESSEAAETTRSQRRRTETRSRIVKAAERLMRERGVEAVTIHDITEAADVGHGTFYLHFKTKGDVLRPVIEQLAERLHAHVDRATGGAVDPAVRMATGVRIALRTIVGDPLWNWYVFRSGTPFRRLAEGMDGPPAKDMDRGVASGRFFAADLPATWAFIDGAMTGVLTALSRGTLGDDAVETTAELVLRSLGIGAEEASRIARRPLALH